MGKPTIPTTRRKEEVTMTSQSVPVCGEHQVAKEWRPTTFEYGEDGVSIRVPNIFAWVCPQDGEASFTPETVDQLIDTVRELIEPAKHARGRRSLPTEYIVSVA
jgi:YgiT-type zinc finger domain-containing protein